MENNNSKKKILLVTRPISPPWDEASKNFAYNLAVNSLDFEFTLLTHGIIPNLPKNIHQEPIYTSNSFGFFQKIRLLKYLRKSKDEFDILHFLYTPTKLNSALVRTMVRTNLRYKKIKTIQTVATLREDLFKDADFKKILFADKIITYSKYAKNKLIKLGFNNAESRTEPGSGTGIEQVYPGTDLELYSPAPKDTKLLATYDLRQDDFVVTYPGEYTRLGAIDDITELIIQYSSILYQNSIKIVFACRVKNKEGLRKKEEIQRLLKEKDLEKIVRFTDTFTTMDKMINSSDIILFPVRDMKGKFDVPLVVVEAMACEKPVIISDLEILKEFANEQNSVIIKSGDIKQLMDAILDLYQNKEKREMIGKNARIFVEDNFDIKKISRKYIEIYRNL